MSCVEPTATWSRKLKFAFLMVKVAAPVATVIVAPLSVARLEPPKLPLPLCNVTVAVPPAFRVETIPQTLTHLKFPSGHRPSTRNWPAVAPPRPRVAVLVTAAESARGTPMQKGSLERVTPVDPPEYSASCTVKGTFTAAMAGRTKTALRMKSFFIYAPLPPKISKGLPQARQECWHYG